MMTIPIRGKRGREKGDFGKMERFGCMPT